MNRIKTATKYLLSPKTYPFLIRLVKTRLFGGSMDLNATQKEASKWCRSRAVSTEGALLSLGFLCVDPEHQFSDTYSRSRTIVASCPQKMGGAGNSRLLYSLVEGLNANVVVETGVAYGWSSLAILLAMTKNPAARLYSSNLHYSTYKGDEQHVGCAVPEHLRQQWTLIPRADEEAIPEILNLTNSVDLIHYDSSKSYEGRMTTYPVLWQALRIGGLFVSDDVDDNIGFKHFCIMLGVTPIIVETPQPSGRTKYVGVIRKLDTRIPKDIVF